MRPFTLGLLSDFNVRNLAALIVKASDHLALECVDAGYGQAMRTIRDDQSDFWRSELDAVFVWTLPQHAATEFDRVVSFEDSSADALLDGVDQFAALAARLSQRVGLLLLPSWVAPGIGRGLGPLELQNRWGVTNALMRMNLRLADRVEGNQRIVLLDAQRWLAAAGARAYSPQLWYMSKTPFHSAVFAEAAKDIVAACNGALGRSRKIVLLDLDNTLWGGIVGDSGWEKLRLGGHDPLGEAFAEFQKALKQLTRRGIVLGLVSKNEEAVALDAIRRHPEMILKPEDFAGWRINWRDKAENVRDLLASLNLGAEAAVFLDDSPFERARVREALPAVLVPNLPEDPMYFASFLRDLRVFDSVTISQEDRARTSMYVADRERSVLREGVTSAAEWLRSLELKVTVERLHDGNLERAAQLFNKTNQMNLKTRRLTAPGLLAWAGRDGHALWTFRVSDRFGDYGLCGLCSFVQSESTGLLFDFVLSCRVFGRGVEETMLTTVASHARQVGCRELLAEYGPTPKNQPCERWFTGQSCFVREGDVFRSSLDEVPVLPDYVSVILV